MSRPKIFGWAADYAGCGFYRIELPLREYARRGGTAEWDTTMPEWAREEADVIIGQRVCLPGATKRWQELCAAGRATTVLEIDDDLFNIDPSNRTPYRTFNQPGLLDNLRRNIAAADVVTVTNEPLAEVMRPMNSNVAIVPNRVPAWLLDHFRPMREHITIGWAGSSTHSMDWEGAAPLIGRFLRRNPTVHAHVIGAKFKAMSSWPDERTRVTSWARSVEDYYKLLDFDIGLAPLKSHLFNQSKSYIKALEYAALGIPVVASSVGPYAEFVCHGETGYLVRNDHEWDRLLRDLAHDPNRRMEMDRNAHELAARHTVEGNLDSWLTAWGVTAELAAA